jgi:hypothetical protein
MKHIINGCPINLRGLSAQELDSLVISTNLRLARVQEELESVMGEVVRRCDNVHQLHFEYEGPAVAAPPYLMDPA